MDNWFKSKWFVRGISLVFAVILYIFVQVEIDKYDNDSRIFPDNNEDIETIEKMPIDIRIDEEKYVVSGVPEYAAVTLEGSASTLAATARQKNFDIFVDLKGLEAGTHTVNLKHDNVPKKLNAYIEPKKIEVSIEERSSEEFDVAVDFINTDKLPKGYELGDYNVEPATVTITSSKSIIEQVAVVKVFVDVAGLKEPIDSREVPVNAYDAQGNELNVPIEPESVAVSVDIHNPSKTVPLKISTKGELPKGFALSSMSANVDEVKVFGTSNVLQSIEKISTETIKLSKITESGAIKVGLALPDGSHVKKPKSVEVMVELEQTKTVEDVPINVENLEDGQKVSFQEPEEGTMSVTVTGKQAVVEDIKADDFNIVLDAEGLENGEHQVPVTINGPENVTVKGVLQQATIVIT